MKKLLIAAVSSAVLSFAASGAYAAGELNFYNWTDYTPDDLLEKFQKETGIKVNLDTYDSNETLLAKLKSGATGYDLAVPSQNFVEIMVKEGLLEEANVTAMPNYKYVDSRFKNPTWDPEQKYSSPWQMGTTSFVIRTDLYDGDCSSLKEFFEPSGKAVGQLGVFKTPEEVMNQAHLYLGQEMCTEKNEDFKALQKLFEGQKPAVKIYSSEGTPERIVDGTVVMSSGWNGDMFNARTKEGGTTVKYCFPKEGVVGWFDSLVIPKGAKNIDNAKKFMDFIMKPENMALVSNFASYANAVPDSAPFLNPELADAPELKVPEGVPIAFGRSCGEKYTKAVDKIWTKLLQ